MSILNEERYERKSNDTHPRIEILFCFGRKPRKAPSENFGRGYPRPNLRSLRRKVRFRRRTQIGCNEKREGGRALRILYGDAEPRRQTARLRLRNRGGRQNKLLLRGRTYGYIRFRAQLLQLFPVCLRQRLRRIAPRGVGKNRAVLPDFR